jgi:hypothetical protein
MECGPDTGDKGVVNSAELTSAGVDLLAFWSQAVSAAGRKSPRMLAALLHAVEDESLDTRARAEKARVLDYLSSMSDR